jgi:tetratricopeptide (TPR) repeat protein
MNKISFLVISLLLLCNTVQALNEQYVTLRKYLSARMYGEAYMELLRNEVTKDEFDPKLEKLRKDLLDRTEKRLKKQAKVSPDDQAIFVILADINFHKGNMDAATEHITTAFRNKSGPLANYVFSKILFKKGNISHAYDQMGKVLESMPDSPVVFADFQFLYSCNSYGVATARKIVKNTNFIKRATPLSDEGASAEAPASPFENDPTTPPEVVQDPDATQDTQVSELPDEPDGIANSEIVNDVEEPVDEVPLPDEVDVVTLPNLPDAGDLDVDIERPMPVADPTSEPTVVNGNIEEDPEQEKIKQAEYWMEQANRQFENGNYDDAKNNLSKSVGLYEGVTGKEELEQKLKAKFDLFERYKIARGLFDEEKYEQALPTILEAYEEEPEKFKEAPFYLGKIYLLKPQPEKLTALNYLEKVVNGKDLDPLFKRDLQWTILEILYELNRFEEADKLFTYFTENEIDFAKNQPDFNQLKYGIWYNLNKLWVNIGLGIFALLFIIVFALQLLPAITLAFLKPENVAKRAFEKQNYQKATAMAEKALNKKLPLQLIREMQEILVKAHFELKNYVRCQDYAKELLEKFSGNTVAWSYLAKASIASNDTSSEAIAMYETIYKDNPEKTEYLPILAHHYAKNRNYTLEAMGTLFTYYQTDPDEPQIVIALAEGYVQNRTMGSEVITVLEEALRIEDRNEFRELLARNYAKSGRYADASRECLMVLEENLNNMGIHVVYSSSMKKLNMLEEAIKQYEAFLQKSPGNEQLLEILNGLKKDAETKPFSQSSEPELPELSSFSDELPEPDLPEPRFIEPGLPEQDIDIENFVEPPPEGFNPESDNESVPLPDFLQEEQQEPQAAEPAVSEHQDSELADLAIDPSDLDELDPFATSDSLFDEFAEELPEELGGPAKQQEVQNSNLVDNSLSASTSEIPRPQPASHSNNDQVSADHDLTKAKELAAQKKYAEVIQILNPIYASERNKEVGLLLADALIESKEPVMAMEIIETLDIDPELMSEAIKDILYRTGMALETNKKIDEALRMYDMICNVDINYKDAFDRSDKLYSRKKG